jgi:hypothetical protein
VNLPTKTASGEKSPLKLSRKRGLQAMLTQDAVHVALTDFQTRCRLPGTDPHEGYLDYFQTTRRATSTGKGKNANPGGNFRFDTALGPAGGFIFNLSTTGRACGTYSLQFTAGGDPLPSRPDFRREVGEVGDQPEPVRSSPKYCNCNLTEQRVAHELEKTSYDVGVRLSGVAVCRGRECPGVLFNDFPLRFSILLLIASPRWREYICGEL